MRPKQNQNLRVVVDRKNDRIAELERELRDSRDATDGLRAHVDKISDSLYGPGERAPMATFTADILQRLEILNKLAAFSLRLTAGIIRAVAKEGEDQ